MKKIIFIFNLLFLLSSFSVVNAGQTISMFNFNGSSIDENDAEAAKMTKQISSHFIDLMKSDMAFIEEVNFISTQELDRELIEVRKSLLQEVKKKISSGMMDIIPRSDLSDIVRKVSRNSLNELQLDALTDSLAVLVSTSTKDVTRDMLLSNYSNDGQWGEITASDLEDFIESITQESIWKSTFSNMIASSKNDFDIPMFAHMVPLLPNRLPPGTSSFI